MPRTIVYVDALNLYNGCLKGGPCKWLNLEQFFKRLLPNDAIERIHYFTADMIGDKGARQKVYLTALTTTPLVNIITGKFKHKDVNCRVSGCCHAGDRKFTVMTEKRTDVSIALQMLEDALRERCDRMILVSGDSDLVPAVVRVRENMPHIHVKAYVPSRTGFRGESTELKLAASSEKNLPMDLLPKCQFPVEVETDTGTIRKPKDW